VRAAGAWIRRLHLDTSTLDGPILHAPSSAAGVSQPPRARVQSLAAPNDAGAAEADRWLHG